MTVCIAALCNNGQGCILTSDQMTTANIPMGYEFENEEVSKIIEVRDGAFVLTAGDVLFSNEAINMAKTRIITENIQSAEGIGDAIRQAYQQIRKTRIIRTELESRGLDLGAYLNMQQKLNPAIVQLVDNAFRNYHPQVEFIFVGKDGNSCHIYTILNPGDIFCQDPIGFAAIGSGAPHALYSLIEANYKKSMDAKTVKELVEKAKQRSEVAPGVGSATSTQEI